MSPFVTDSLWLWIGFNVLVLTMLELDLGWFHRKAHVVSVREAIAWGISRWGLCVSGLPVTR